MKSEMRNLSETLKIVSCFPLVFAGQMKYNSTFFLKISILIRLIMSFISSQPHTVSPVGALKTLTATNRRPLLGWTDRERNDPSGSAKITDS